MDRTMLERLQALLAEVSLALDSIEQDQAANLNAARTALRAATDIIELEAAPVTPATESYKDVHDKKPIIIDDLLELNIGSTPSLLTQLLQLLPVQIYIKEVKLDLQRGRKYIWLNSEATKRAQRADGTVPIYDGDAFQGGPSSSDWRAMNVAETTVMNQSPDDRLRLHPLRWTNSYGTWRVNNVLQVPIFLRGERHAVAFCAIAEDITFRHLQSGFIDVTRAMVHELGNARAIVNSSIGRALRHLKNSRNDVVAILLEDAHQYTEHMSERGELIIQSLYETHRITETIQTIIDDLRNMTKTTLFNVQFELPSSIADRSIGTSAETKVILLELLRNARKHGAGTGDAIPNMFGTTKQRTLVKVSERDSEHLQWEVTNDYNKTKLGKFSPQSGRRGARIVAQICEDKFNKSFEEVIKCPQMIVDGRVTFVAIIPTHSNQ